MLGSVLEIHTDDDGSVVICPHGAGDPERADEFRHALVHTLRRVRPLRLIVDLSDVPEPDPIELGSVVAACDLGDDHQVPVFVCSPSGAVTDRLTAAGVPRQRVSPSPHRR
ncbi:STAS domain-containing protein [Actinoplanes sp. HUAS TT8]|uniref:STAS domain-containing protein n=1 Tax=Actinoplanes sp. HUAS TT8 TaxID=3447453 RepID=UPI003F51AE66